MSTDVQKLLPMTAQLLSMCAMLLDNPTPKNILEVQGYLEETAKSLKDMATWENK